MLKYFGPEYKPHYCGKVMESMKKLFKMFGEEDYIFNDAAHVFQAYDAFFSFHQEFGNSKERDKLFDDIKMKLSIGFLKCPILEKKLAAIAK